MVTGAPEFQDHGPVEVLKGRVRRAFGKEPPMRVGRARPAAGKRRVKEASGEHRRLWLVVVRAHKPPRWLAVVQADVLAVVEIARHVRFGDAEILPSVAPGVLFAGGHRNDCKALADVVPSSPGATHQARSGDVSGII